MGAVKPTDFSPVDEMRHSTAHVLAAAVQELYPEAKFGVGPVIENGFYYDIELSRSVTPQDLNKIEKRMRRIVERNEEFRREELPIDRAVEFFRERNQDFKVELLKALKEKGTTSVSEEEQDAVGGSAETASIYWTGEGFVDLCRGPHVGKTGEIEAFKLTKVAGAYWRGNEDNPMLQRIYGLAFATKEELDEHLKMLEEAEKRDHRKLGVELDLFTFSDLVGPGLPLWTPRGELLRELLDDFVWELRRKRDYDKVEIPHITKKDLYERSGHWEKYKDDLFRFKTREGHEFAMKPMNCPHHTQIYARRPWSYRELPQRYANSTMCYRDEQTGELSGLSRVRAFTQDDAHVFCRMPQAKEEFLRIWDIVNEFYPTFGFELQVRLSLHDPDQPDKYLGDKDKWSMAEGMLKEIVEEKGVEWFEGVGEAAFYGPKLDFMAKDALGRKWQVATIQLDLNMPERFDLTCINEQGEKERIVMIHAAIMGSFERFLSILIEHTGGAFPVWLAPVQVQVVPVGQDHWEACRRLVGLLEEEGIRVGYEESQETVGKQIRKAEKAKVPYMLVIGDREKSLENLTVRKRGDREETQLSREEFLSRVQRGIAVRSAEL